MDGLIWAEYEDPDFLEKAKVLPRRKINYLVVHCTGAAQNQSVTSIKQYWRQHLKWKNFGYHAIIDKYGKIHWLASEDTICNGVGGFNKNSLHVCYIGGQHKDDRTDAQKTSIIFVLKKWRQRHLKAIIQGHRDFPNVAKACPQFNAKIEYQDI